MREFDEEGRDEVLQEVEDHLEKESS
jgi:hypothetical protein